MLANEVVHTAFKNNRFGLRFQLESWELDACYVHVTFGGQISIVRRRRHGDGKPFYEPLSKLTRGGDGRVRWTVTQAYVELDELDHMSQIAKDMNLAAVLEETETLSRRSVMFWCAWILTEGRFGQDSKVKWIVE